MTLLIVLAVAAAIFFADKLEPILRDARSNFQKVEQRHWLAVGVLVAGLVAWRLQPTETDAGPAPVPGAVGELDLSGLFIGPTAADDAAAMSALCDELATAVEYDGTLERPRLNTGWAIADLRGVARDVRLKGHTFGERQPAVRDAVKTYLERPEILGTGGGPLSPKDRAKWVASFRDIARAAEAAIR